MLTKQNLLRAFTPALEDYRQELLNSAQRSMGPRVFIFFLDRAVDALTSLLYAINEVYDPADKRAERTILSELRTVPPHFMARWSEVLHGPFDDAGASYRAQVFDQLTADVLTLAQQALEDDPQGANMTLHSQ